MKEKMAKVFYHYISFLALQETCDWFNANYDTARKWSLHQIINTFKGNSSVWSSLLVFVFSAILYSNFLNHLKRKSQYGFNWYISQRIKKILKELNRYNNSSFCSEKIYVFSSKGNETNTETDKEMRRFFSLDNICY